MTLWAVVPVKPLAEAKGRLAGLLAAEERVALARALLADVLDALCVAPGVARVLVVSADPAALALAESHGAAPLVEPVAPGGWTDGHAGATVATPGARAAEGALAGDAEAGLNRALDEAARVAAAAGATALLALPADVPLVEVADLVALSEAVPRAPAVVVAPTADGGTGALLRCGPLAVPARFGPRSVEAHLRAASERGVEARLVWRANLSLDIDRPADLLGLAALPTRTRTQALLVGWNLARRALTHDGVAAAPGRR